MDFGVLGPLTVRGPHGPVEVVGRKERVLLAHLVSVAGRMATVDELALSLWGDAPPRAPAKALQTYVLRLRNALEPDRKGVPTVVVTEGSGYRLAVAGHGVDAMRFAQLAAAGRSAIDAGRPADAATDLRLAEGLWRGPAYTGFEDTPFGMAEVQRLDELRTSATEDLWAAEIDLGRASAAIPELERLVEAHPWRERAWGSLVLALFRAGRQGDALGAVERARARLADELGIDPGPELRRLHERVLAQDAELLRLPDAVSDTGHHPSVDPAEQERLRAEAAALVRREAHEVAVAGEQLRGGRAALAEGLFALQSSPSPDSLPADVCPWRGLASYDVEDRGWFAGRERLVAELLARVEADRLVVLVGASGSGKSSLARAGLVGAIAAGTLMGSARWTTVVMRPGAAPMRELASRALGATQAAPTLGDLLLRMAEEGAGAEGELRTLLLVDQLEEVWTACSDEHERQAFLDALAAIAHETDTHVVLVVRGDHFPLLAGHPALASLARDATLLVGAPTRAEVRRMVEVPARAAGLDLEPGLAETISDDAGDAAGLLPLLSTSLMQLWERREGRRLTYAHYVGLGGLTGAVAHLAEEAYAALDEPDRAVARVVLLRLAGGTAGGDVVRRRVPLAVLDGLPGNTAEVVSSLAGARLLTVDDEAVEVAHESLFREWPRLAAWVADDEATRGVQQRLAVAAAEWAEAGRDPGRLWRGAGLESALDVVSTHPDESTELECEFLAAGEAAVDAERRDAEDRAEQRERQNRLLRGLLAAAAVLLVVAVVAGILTVASRRATAEARDREAAAAVAADARRLAASSLNEEQLDVALLHAVEAVRTEPGPETHGALLSLLARTPDLLLQRRAETPFLRADASHDAAVVAVSEYDPHVIALDAVNGEEQWSRDVPGQGHVLSIVGGPQGFLVTAWDDGGGTAVHLWDDRTGADVWSLGPADLEPLLGVADTGIAGADWLPDGRVVLLTDSHLVLLSPGGRPRRVVPLEPGPPPGLLRAWPDGRVSYEAPLDVGHVLDPDRPRSTLTLDFSVPSVSPDGGLVLTADRSRPDRVRLRLRDAHTFEPRGEEIVVSSFDDGVDWTPDGSSLVIGAGEQLQVHNRRGRLLAAFSGAHSGAIMAPVIGGPEQDVVWSAGRDGLLSAWSLADSRGLLTSTTLGTSPSSGQASTDGHRVVAIDYVESDLNEAFLVDPASGDVTELAMPERCACQPWAVGMAGDGSVAAGAVNVLGPASLRQDRGYVVVWDPSSGAIRHEVRLPWDPVGVAVTPDGRYAVVNGRDGIAVVDLGSGELAGRIVDREPMTSQDGVVRIDGDGRTAAVVRDAQVLLLDVASHEVLATRELESSSATALDGTALGWAGTDLAVGVLDGRMMFLDGRSLETVAPPREVSAGFVIDILQVGAVVASLGTDGDVRLWDPATWSPIGLPVTEENAPGFLSGTPDTLRAWFEGGSLGRPGRVRDLALDPDGWVSRACTLAGRQLSTDEWDVIRPSAPWRETCTQP